MRDILVDTAFLAIHRHNQLINCNIYGLSVGNVSDIEKLIQALE